MVIMNVLTIRGAFLMAAVAALAGSCSKAESTASPTPGPASSTTITITSTGVSPRNSVVPRGSQVTFVNSDGSVHEMYSDPHPEHTDCPELDSVGRLSPGQSRQTTNLVAARTCSFHDHLSPFNNSLKGAIVIQ
jgi:hypothetical protein